MIKQDYTEDCLTIINKIILEGRKIPKPTIGAVEEYNPEIRYSNNNWDGHVVTAVLKPPKEVYQDFFDEAQIKDPIFSWALWWATEKGIVKHYGPAGSKGWTLHRADPVRPAEVYVGEYSPFKPDSILSHLDQVLKYSQRVYAAAVVKQNEAEKSIETKLNELESEKQYARIQSKFNWS